MKPHFLVIDDNRDASSLISRALLQRFPQAQLTEFSSFAVVRDELLRLPMEAAGWIVVAGRVADLETVPLVRAIRVCHRSVPVIAMGEPPDESETLQAGANRFLAYEAWLLLAPAVDRLLGGQLHADRASRA